MVKSSGLGNWSHVGDKRKKEEATGISSLDDLVKSWNTARRKKIKVLYLRYV